MHLKTTFASTRRNRNYPKVYMPRLRHSLRDKHSFLKILFSLSLTDSSFKYPDSNSRKPAVPRHTEVPQMGTTSGKNFIATNVAANVTAGKVYHLSPKHRANKKCMHYAIVPKKPVPKYVDTAGGDRHDLEVCTQTIAMYTLLSY